MQETFTPNDPFNDREWTNGEPMPWDKVKRLLDQASDDMRTVCSSVWGGNDEIAGVVVSKQVLTMVGSPWIFDLDPREGDIEMLHTRRRDGQTAAEDICLPFTTGSLDLNNLTWWYQPSDCNNWKPWDETIYYIHLVGGMTLNGTPVSDRVAIFPDYAVIVDKPGHQWTPQTQPAPFCTTLEHGWALESQQPYGWFASLPETFDWFPNDLAYALARAAVPSAPWNTPHSPFVTDPDNATPRGYAVPASFCNAALGAKFIRAGD
jgi:hypothetical protein